MSKLLIDDRPIQVLPKLAELIGLNEAIVIQQIHYWLNNSNHDYDGKRWIYNSYPNWVKQFPFWSERTIKRVFGSLEKQELLYVGNYNKAGFDRTKWYSINYEMLNNLVARPSGQNGPTIRTNCHDGKGQNGPTNTIDYTETTTEITNNRETVVSAIFEYLNKNLEIIQTPSKVQEIEYLISDFKQETYAIFKIAIDYCREKQKGVNYLIAILKNWAKEGVNTKEKAEDKLKRSHTKQTSDRVLKDLESKLLGGPENDSRGSTEDY